MQLHPFFATVSRPVFWDGISLFLQADCPECRGYGDIEVNPIDPSRRAFTVTCDCCGGEGKVLVQTDEDELADA